MNENLRRSPTGSPYGARGYAIAGGVDRLGTGGISAPLPRTRRPRGRPYESAPAWRRADVVPPSTSRSIPVTKEAASEQR